MKTFRILPWYLLLLMIGLCAAISTREGMTVAVKDIDAEYTVNSGVQLLKNKFNEYFSKDKDLHVVVISDSISSRLNPNVVNAFKGKRNYIVLNSKDDTKTNAILAHVSENDIHGDKMLLTANTNYETHMYSTKMFIPATNSIVKEVNAIIKKNFKPSKGKIK